MCVVTLTITGRHVVIPHKCITRPWQWIMAIIETLISILGSILDANIQVKIALYDLHKLVGSQATKLTTVGDAVEITTEEISQTMNVSALEH